MSLMDVIIGTALVLIVFVVLMGLLRASLLIASSSKAKAGATAVATAQMEYLRTLPYENVGTVGGIPAGPVAQYATKTLNGIPYGVRTLVQYVDDPADGTGAGDRNGIVTDYKRVRIATTYQFRGEEREVALISTVAPASMETLVDGGTLRIRVVDADGAPVPGASVHVVNEDLMPAVDFITFTDITGVVVVPGAPASGAYQVAVSKDGYSSATTYARDETNQNPTPGYLTVALSQTTESTFSIDVLGTIAIRTYFPIAATSSVDMLDTLARVTDITNVAHADSAIMLQADAEGAYAAHGSFITESVSVPLLATWTSAAWSSAVPLGTTLHVRVLDSSGSLLPESVLPGNAAGFTASPIALDSIATTTYPQIRLAGTLATTDAHTTPAFLDWTVTAEAGPLPAPGIGFTLTGEKRRGTTGAGAPLSKTIIATSTDAAGVSMLSLEWDVYALDVPGHTLIAASSSAPYTLAPGAALEAALIVQ